MYVSLSLYIKKGKYSDLNDVRTKLKSNYLRKRPDRRVLFRKIYIKNGYRLCMVPMERNVELLG